MPRLQRSIYLKPEYKETAKQAVRLQGFSSQGHLADCIPLARSTVNQFLNGKSKDVEPATKICAALKLDVYQVTNIAQLGGISKPRIDWGEATENAQLAVRNHELDSLVEKLDAQDRRLVRIEGMPGMGKNNLSYRLAQKIHARYEFVIWRSLDQYTSIRDLLTEWLHFFSCESSDVSGSDEQLWNDLKAYLNEHRCLLIVTNIDLALRRDPMDPMHRDLLRMLRTVVCEQRGSCLIVTSDIASQEIDSLTTDNNVHVLRWEVSSLSIPAIKEIFNEIGKENGAFSATEEDWLVLQDNYLGNPFVLKNIAINIQRTFAGDISSFIAFGTPVFNGTRAFLSELLSHLTDAEQAVMYWLAICRHPLTLFELKDIVSGAFDDHQLLTIIKRLSQRFLIESKQEGIMVLPPMIREFVVNRLVFQISQNIIDNDMDLIAQYPLLITSVRAALVKDQKKFLLQPIISRLKAHFGTERVTIERLLEILHGHQRLSDQFTKYASGNLVNLLNQMGFEWSDQDLSNLTLKNVDFQNATLNGVNFANTDLSGSLFLSAFGNILSTAFSPDGEYMAAGDANDQIYVWRVGENRPVLDKILTGYSYWVRSLAFSPDSKYIASAGEDGNVCIRDVETWLDITLFEGHLDRVRAIAFSPDASSAGAFSVDEKYLASGSDDRTVRVWDLVRREFLTSLVHHSDKVRAVEFLAKSRKLLSASQNSQICIWRFTSEDEIVLDTTYWLMDNPACPLRTVSISPDDRRLVSGHDDGIIRLWDLETGEFLQQFAKRHNSWIRNIHFSPDGKMIASSSEDKTICLWDATTGECLHTLRRHSGRVWSVAFHPKRSWLVSGGDGLKIKLWNTENGDCLGAFRGYNHETRPIAFSPDGELLATGNNQAAVDLKDSLLEQHFPEKFRNGSGNIWALSYSPDGYSLVGGSDDKHVKIWNTLKADTYPKSLPGHSNWIRTIAYSPDGKLIASGSDDKTIRVWNAITHECIHTFAGENAHVDWVRSLVFHPTEPILISAGDDGNIKIWSTDNWNLMQSVRTLQRQIWSISVHPGGTYLVSGSNDKTLRLWNVHTFECLVELAAHQNWVSCVAFSPDGQYLASGSYDTTIRLWQLENEQFVCRRILQGHGRAVTSITFHPLSPILASSSKDGSVRLWNYETGDLVKTWRSPRPYEAMNMAGITGLNKTEKLCLRDLGAINVS